MGNAFAGTGAFAFAFADACTGVANAFAGMDMGTGMDTCAFACTGTTNLVVSRLAIDISTGLMVGLMERNVEGGCIIVNPCTFACTFVFAFACTGTGAFAFVTGD